MFYLCTVDTYVYVHIYHVYIYIYLTDHDTNMFLVYIDNMQNVSRAPKRIQLPRPVVSLAGGLSPMARTRDVALRSHGAKTSILMICVTWMLEVRINGLVNGNYNL